MNGFQKKMGSKVDVIHLSLTSRVGKQAAAKYTVRVAPTTLIFDQNGKIIFGYGGVPKPHQLMRVVTPMPSQE